MPLVAGIDVAASSSSSPLQWSCLPTRTLHNSKKTASMTAPKKVPGIARRLQLGVLVNAGAVEIWTSNACCSSRKMA